MRITRRHLRNLIVEMAGKRKQPQAMALMSLNSLPKVSGDIGVVLTADDYAANKKKMSNLGLQIARFAHSSVIPLYRIVDAEEFNNHIPASGGVISGGTFQPDEERAFGASFGFDPVQLVKNFAQGSGPEHLHSGNNYLIQIQDANGLMFANMELTYDKRGFRDDFGLSGGSKNSPYKSSFGSKLKPRIKLPFSFTVPQDMCHGVLGCQMIVDTKSVKALYYQIDSRGDLTPVPPTW